MIRLHCTQKLLAKLPLDTSGQLRSRHSLYPPPAANDEFGASPAGDIVSPLSGWHGNLITLQRRQCVLLVHDATRFPVFIPCLTKPDFAELGWHFGDVFMNTLLKVGADDSTMQRAHHALAPLVCDRDIDRSVQGTLNQMAQDLAYSLDYKGLTATDLLPYSTSAWLAQRPCRAKGVKDCIWPIDAMLGLISGLPD